MNSTVLQDTEKKDIYIDSCGLQFINSESGKLNTFSWSDYHILYVTEGTGYAFIDEKRIKMSAGSILVFSPWQHRDYGFHRNQDSRSYYLHFNGNACASLISSLGLDEEVYHHIGLSLSLSKLFDSLIEEFRLKNRHYEYMCHSYMIAILTLISRKISVAPREASPNKKRIKEICKYIYENCNKIESVGMLARMLHLSESRFSHLFFETVGVSPQRYILRARTDMAKELLANTDLSIGQIAVSVGFNDQNYFSRAFKRFTDMSPTEYRRIFTESH